MYYFSFTSNFVDLNMTLTQNDFGLPLKLCPANPIGNFFLRGWALVLTCTALNYGIDIKFFITNHEYVTAKIMVLWMGQKHATLNCEL